MCELKKDEFNAYSVGSIKYYEIAFFRIVIEVYLSCKAELIIKTMV